jgi:hypothetical protein
MPLTNEDIDTLILLINRHGIEEDDLNRFQSEITRLMKQPHLSTDLKTVLIQDQKAVATIEAKNHTWEQIKLKLQQMKT